MTGDGRDAVDEIDELMKKGGTVSIEQIMNLFITMDKNLILKTDIENSKNFTILKVIIADLQNKGLKKSAKTLSNFCDWYIKVRVSHSRLSRKEVLEAIAAVKKENAATSIGAKLFGFGNKEGEGK